VKRIRGKRLALVLLTLCLLCLTGCSRLEIEDRAFPLALLICPADEDGMYDFYFFFEEDSDESAYHQENTRIRARNYPQAYARFSTTRPSELDDTHMQVILLQQEIMQDFHFYCGFFTSFQTEQHFSWNTMIYLTDGSLDVEQLEQATGGRPGTYLRDMAEHDAGNTDAFPTLGDLFIEWNNGEGDLTIPLLGEHAPAVEEYLPVNLERITSEGD
jgi:hypothetical protein